MTKDGCKSGRASVLCLYLFHESHCFRIGDHAMNEPYPSSIIGILQVVLRVLEKSSSIPQQSPALIKIREGVAAMVVELEPLARLEPHAGTFRPKTGPDLYMH